MPGSDSLWSTKPKRSNEASNMSREAHQSLRLQAIKAARTGRPIADVADVADVFDIHERTLYHWLARFAAGGQDALCAKPRSGRPAKVTAEEMHWIARVVREQTPLQMNFPYALWTLSLIRELICRHLGKSLALASVSRIMQLLGFSPQKPLYEAWQRVRRWECELHPQIRSEARRLGATIYFADEAGLRSDYHTSTTWAPVGKTPVVKKTGWRFSVNRLSALSYQGEFRFMIHAGTVNAEVFRTFLQRLRMGTTKPVFVVVDGHPAHKAKIVRDYVRSTDGMLRLFFLPPYAPAPQLRRAGLGAGQARGLQALCAKHRADEAPCHERLAPNPEPPGWCDPFSISLSANTHCLAILCEGLVCLWKNYALDL